MEDDAVIKLRGVTFTYEKGKNANKILDNVNLTVPTGKIYALLGPSGCGKTTILRLITGRLKLKQGGDIFVFGQKPLSNTSIIPGPAVGYMPQEQALHGELSIEETLMLFGRLNGIKECNLTAKIEEMCKVLDLPLGGKRIENLSGGQQRRVSLASALLHNAPLLIIDEPTVGVDPLLRRTIWNHLTRLAATRNTTVIITTHYIEEAKGANIIGAMRHGRILVEASPMRIMKHFNDYNLDSCFSRLCHMDQTKESMEILAATNDMEERPTERANEERKVSFSDKFDSVTTTATKMREKPGFFSKCNIMAKRNLVILMRHFELTLFQCFIPLSQIVLYCLTVGNEMKDLPVSVVIEDARGGYPDKFVHHLTENIIYETVFENFNDGLNTVIDGNSWAMLHMRRNYTNCFKKRLELGLDVDEETLNCSTIFSYVDATNNPKFYVLFRSFFSSFQSYFEDILRTMGKTTMIARYPIDFNYPIYGSKEESLLAEYMIPGVIVLIAHFLSAAVTGIILTYEKRNGMEEKLWVAGVNKVDLLFSHFLTQLATVLVQNFLVLVFAFWVFNQPLHGSVIHLLIIVIGQGIAGMAFGFFLSAMIPDERGIIYAFLGAMFSNLTAGSICWPRHAQSPYLKAIFNFLPVTMPTEAIRAIMSKGWGLSYPIVIWGIVSTYGWLTFYLGTAVIKLKYFS